MVNKLVFISHGFYLVRAKNIEEIHAFKIPESGGVFHGVEDNEVGKILSRKVHERVTTA